MDLIQYSDNFKLVEKDGETYEPRGVAFLMKNTGNTVVTLNKRWILKPCETYGLLNHIPNAVCNSSYLVNFGNTNVIGDGADPINQISIAEVHYSGIKQSIYAQ